MHVHSFACTPVLGGPHRVGDHFADGHVAIPGDRWCDTCLPLGAELCDVDFEDALSGRKIRAAAQMPIAELIPELPVALFVNTPRRLGR